MSCKTNDLFFLLCKIRKSPISTVQCMTNKDFSCTLYSNTIQNKEICYACHAKIWKSIILATQKIKEIPEPCHAKDVKNPFFLAVKTCNKFLVPAVPCNKSYSMSNLRNPKFLYCNSLGLIPAMKNMHDILDHCRRNLRNPLQLPYKTSLIPAMQNIKEIHFIPAMQKIQEFLDSCHAKSARKSISLPCKTCTKFLIPAMQNIQEILDSCHAEHARNS